MKMKALDNATLEAIAELICGDEGPFYRKGSMLPTFFRNAGLDCPPHDGSTRKWWTLARLEEYNTHPESLEKVIKRLANPKEYRGDLEITNNVLIKLNEILSVEGLKVELRGVNPIIHEITPTLIEKKKTSKVFPIPDFSTIVNDSSLREILKIRWQETLKCIENGAYLSAIIMMGSILEGVLLSALHNNPKEANKAKSSPKDKKGNVKKFSEWTLSDMIDVAHERGWLKGDVKQFSHSLRDYRNMVHPWHQKAKGENPDEDTCRICWQVVVAAINDLIETFGRD
jgi:hypothetical protein